MKRITHSSHENVAFLGTTDGTTDGTVSKRNNAEQDEAELTGSAGIGEATGSAEMGVEARTQADAGLALGSWGYHSHGASFKLLNPTTC